MNIFILFSFFIFAFSAYGEPAKHYIVYMGHKFDGDYDALVNSNHELLSKALGSEPDVARNAIVHHYHKSFRGFSAMLRSKDVHKLKQNEDVVSVFESTSYKLHTTRSWNFMTSETTGFGKGLLEKYSTKHHDVLVGHLDTGIWPESPSFDDQSLSAVPGYFYGECVGGRNFPSSLCNKKIVGARHYSAGYEVEHSITAFNPSVRDYDGHGTQTASVIAGHEVKNSNISNLKLTPKGGAPNAHLAVYKVCWNNGHCSCSDILKAFDDAIYDRVDIISFAGGPKTLVHYLEDCVAIGAFHAFKNGITVVSPAGNDADHSSVVNVAPWILTVAASTIDREFENSVVLGDGRVLKGHAFTEIHNNDFHKLVHGEGFCNDHKSLGRYVRGKTVVCKMEKPTADRAAKSLAVKNAGGTGMIIIDEGDSSNFYIDRFVISTSILDKTEGGKLESYMTHKKSSAIARITSTKELITTIAAPKMAVYSSKGPNRITPSIIKPDVTAPGFNIIAANSPSRDENMFDYNYKFSSGTSISSSHVAGVAAVIKATNKLWTPAEIKSAIMTSASTLDNTNNPIKSGKHHATPFDFGSGHLEPDNALTPSLVYPFDANDLIDFFCYHYRSSSRLHKIFGKKKQIKCGHLAPYHLNYPSISIPEMEGPTSVKRTVRYVSERDSPFVFKPIIVEPKGIRINVVPDVLDFSKRGTNKLTYRVDFNPLRLPGDGDGFGSITWTDGSRHNITIPIYANFAL